MDSAKTPSKRWVNIATFSTDWEAHIALGILESNGIKGVLSNEQFASVYPIGFNTIGGIGLSVPEESAAEARELIKKVDE